MHASAVCNQIVSGRTIYTYFHEQYINKYIRICRIQYQTVLVHVVMPTYIMTDLSDPHDHFFAHFSRLFISDLFLNPIHMLDGATTCIQCVFLVEFWLKKL